METQLQERFEWVIKRALTDEDDLGFWIAAFDVLLRDIEALDFERCRKYEIYIQIGACSHWLRPHQTRWTAAGGFAWPVGYMDRFARGLGNTYGPIGDGLPEFEWFALFHWNHEQKTWNLVEPKFTGKRKLIFRAALPTRTKRHPQAAIHTIWSPGSPEYPTSKVEQFYGFRKIEETWECVATRKRRVGNPVKRETA